MFGKQEANVLKRTQRMNQNGEYLRITANSNSLLRFELPDDFFITDFF